MHLLRCGFSGIVITLKAPMGPEMDRSEIGPYLGSRLFQGRYPSEICPVDPFQEGYFGLYLRVFSLIPPRLRISEVGRFLLKPHVCGAGPLEDRFLPRSLFGRAVRDSWFGGEGGICGWSNQK